MKRSFLALAAVTVVLGAIAPAADSATGMLGGSTELGLTTTPIVAPSCPPGVAATNCTIILTRTTALPTIRDGVSYPTTVKKSGSVVAFTVGLSRLSANNATAKSDIHLLDLTFRGTTQVAITVLKPIGRHSLFQWQVAAESPVFHVQPYLGYVVELPLPTPLPVAKGDTVALTVPTWAPVLSYQLSPKKFAYRQSRRFNCVPPASSNTAQLTVGAQARYVCDYPGARVEYSATEIYAPPIPKNAIH